jgi:hypothetical protein
MWINLLENDNLRDREVNGEDPMERDSKDMMRIELVQDRV